MVLSWAGTSCSHRLLVLLCVATFASTAGADSSASVAQSSERLPGGLPFFQKAATRCEKCHTDCVAAAGTPHEALGIASCTDCHTPAKKQGGKCQSDEATSWELAATEAKLCGKCHLIAGPAKKHKPLVEGRCTSCHVVHGSTAKNLLKNESAEALCYSCHPSYLNDKVIHAPVSGGDCLACHDPHAGQADPLLSERPDTLCLKCHAVEDLALDRVKHSAVREGYCIGCHNPHSGPARGLVKNDGKKLCLSCHDAKAPRVFGAAPPQRQLDLTKPVVHKPLVKGDCQYCHTQKHSSEFDSLLLRPAVESCDKCHEKWDGKYKFLHGAVKLGDCPVCHDPHSSELPGLVADTNVNKVCFKCHEDDLTGRKWVHKPVVEKGCTACHDPHGSDSPLSLKKTLEGGVLCRSCHEKVGQNVSVPHLALDRYKCTSCHDPHGSDQDSGLRASANRVCTACHQDTQDGTHIGSFGGHKVSGGPDPKRPGKDFSCVSCHAPHGSNSPKILRYGKEPQDSCKYCH